jgi:hypothetical protein
VRAAVSPTRQQAGDRAEPQARGRKHYSTGRDRLVVGAADVLVDGLLTEHSTQRRTALPASCARTWPSGERGRVASVAEWRAALRHAGHPARELDFVIPDDLNDPGHGTLDPTDRPPRRPYAGDVAREPGPATRSDLCASASASRGGAAVRRPKGSSAERRIGGSETASLIEGRAQQGHRQG